MLATVPYKQWFADPDSAEGRSQRVDGVHTTTEFAEQLTTEHLLQAFQTSYLLVTAQSAAD